MFKSYQYDNECYSFNFNSIYNIQSVHCLSLRRIYQIRLRFEWILKSIEEVIALLSESCFQQIKCNNMEFISCLMLLLHQLTCHQCTIQAKQPFGKKENFFKAQILYPTFHQMSLFCEDVLIGELTENLQQRLLQNHILHVQIYTIICEMLVSHPSECFRNLKSFIQLHLWMSQKIWQEFQINTTKHHNIPQEIMHI